MRYHVKNPERDEWLTDYHWDGEEWLTSWSKDRVKAKLMDRTQLGIVKDDLPDGCKCFRGEWADVKAPDGVVSMGRRKVSKAGTVRFAGDKFRHDNLLPFVGQHIFVQAEDYWIIHPHAFKTSAGFADGRENHICDLDAVKEMRD